MPYGRTSPRCRSVKGVLSKGRNAMSSEGDGGRSLALFFWRTGRERRGLAVVSPWGARSQGALINLLVVERSQALAVRVLIPRNNLSPEGLLSSSTSLLSSSAFTAQADEYRKVQRRIFFFGCNRLYMTMRRVLPRLETN